MSALQHHCADVPARSGFTSARRAARLLTSAYYDPTVTAGMVGATPSLTVNGAVYTWFRTGRLIKEPIQAPAAFRSCAEMRRANPGMPRCAAGRARPRSTGPVTDETHCSGFYTLAVPHPTPAQRGATGWPATVTVRRRKRLVFNGHAR